LCHKPFAVKLRTNFFVGFREIQRQGAQRAEARAELSVELAQARILPAYELGR